MKQSRQIKAIVACRDANGVPTLVRVTFDTTLAALAAGDHYDEIWELLEEKGYQRAYVVIDEDDMKSIPGKLGTTLQCDDWPHSIKLN